MDEWIIERNGRLSRGLLSVVLLPSDIARLAAIGAIDELERALAVHTGAPSLRNALGNEATGHDVALYQLQEALRGWRRWTAERDDVEDGAAAISDGTYALRLTPADVQDIVNAPVVADVQAVLFRVASIGRTGRADLQQALDNDGRTVSVQLREIKAVVTEFLTNADDDDA